MDSIQFKRSYNYRYRVGACCGLTLFLCCLSSPHSQVFKWVDENGKVIYGDRPPLEEAEEIEIKPPTARDPALQKRHEKRDKLLNALQEERAEKQLDQEAEKANQKKIEEACALAKEELQKLRDVNILYEETDDPNKPKIISESERDMRRMEQESFIQKNCST